MFNIFFVKKFMKSLLVKIKGMFVSAVLLLYRVLPFCQPAYTVEEKPRFVLVSFNQQ